MIVIARHTEYSIELNDSCNRLSIEIKGLWDGKNMPQYLKDIKKAKLRLASEFYALLDLSKIKQQSYDDLQLHKQAFNAILQFGLLKLAVVIPSDSFLKEYIQDLIRFLPKDHCEFTSRDVAEDWLDGNI